MHPDTYTRLALRTCSDKFHTEKVSPQILLALLIDFARYARAIDIVKRALFYGKDFHIKQVEDAVPLDLNFDEANTAINEIGEPFWALFQNSQSLHGLLGMITEIGELAETIPGVGESIDNKYLTHEENIVEEVGDISWYLAIFCEAGGVKLSEAFEKNIAKLRARFPDKFNETQAVVRQLDAEAAAFSSKE